MGDGLLDRVISTLRPCLLSARNGVPINSLDNEYRQLLGTSIPYIKLGFKTLREFLESVPGLQIQGSNVTAKPTDDSKHITKMIANQRRDSSKRRSRPVAHRSRRPNQGSWRPAGYSSCPSAQPRRSMQSYRTGQSPRTPNTVPLMSIPQKRPLSQLANPPRYMFTNSGSQNISPSKQQSDRKANSSQSSSSSPVVAYKNKAAFEAPTTAQQPPPLFGSNPSTSRQTIRDTQTSRVPETIRNQPPKSVSERLKTKPQPVAPAPQILSPLSPLQSMNGAFNSISNTSSLRQIPITPPLPRPEVPIFMSLSPQDQCPTKQLERLALSMGVAEPAYSIKSWTTAHKKYYGCNVKVGGTSYTSYPEEILSSDDAKKVAAAKAVKELTRGGPQFVQTANKDLVKQRLTMIVHDHASGVFSRQVPTYYTEQYRENLPDNWEQLIEECPGILKDKGAHDSSILLPNFPSEEPEGRINGSRNDVESLPRMDKIQLNPIGPVVPGVLIPPADQFWDVSITIVTSTADIWVRLIGEDYSDKLTDMQNEMEAYYRSVASTIPSGLVEVGRYYAVQEQDSWHRVHCIEFDKATGNAIVFFIDHGDEGTFYCRKLYPLERRFCYLAAQALNLSLVQLEEFSGRWEVSEYLSELIQDKSLVAEVITREMYEDDGEITASVVLWDTKNSDDVNLNEVLLSRIIQFLKPKLNQEGQVSEVYLSHVNESGDVYLQLKSEGMQPLMNLLNKLIQTGLSNEDMLRSEVIHIDRSKVYLVRCFEDGNWYRGVVTNNGPNNQVRVFLVDFGKTITVDKKNHLLDLDQLSAVLAKYPYQALKVRLNDIPDSMFNRELAARLTVLAPSSTVLLAKVVMPASRSSPAVVELFTRVAPNNFLVSINNTLAIDTGLIGSNGDGNNNTRPRKRLERTISRHGGSGDSDGVTKNLKPPKIPNTGSFFDVHVTMAANPGNFTVQPFDDRVGLEAMMVQLQEICVDYSGPSPTPEIVKEGSLYAAKHFDGHYYRVCISKIINEEMVTVYFCDFGDVSVLTLDKLQPLGEQFLKLPYQAIRARLVGVQPVNMDWSVEDCLRFQELVVEKNFVSVVENSGPDPLSPSDTVLGLKLINVNGDTDVYIARQLIEEGRGTATDLCQ